MKNGAAVAVATSAEEKQLAGVRLYEEGRYEQAFAVLGEALRQNEDTPWHLWNDWGAAAFACKQMEKAEAGLKHALALNDGNAEVSGNLGGLLLKVGRPAEAIPYLEVAEAQSSGPHRTAVAQLLATCRERIQMEQAPHPDGCSPLCLSAIAGSPATARYWFPDITGWFLEEEALHLFTAVQLAQPSRILEIGTFYGRSTATICSAIKSLSKPVEFITCDLDFGSEAEFVQAFAPIHKGADVRLPVACHEAFAVGVSTLNYARRELTRHGLAAYVQFEPGDFRRIAGAFGFIFADVLHDLDEIERNLVDIVAKLHDGGILAVHDLTEEHRSAIRRVSSDVHFISQHTHLGVYRIQRGTRNTSRIASPRSKKTAASF
jgi:tetratricopeptide (TPR) repeat protein